MEGTQQQFVAVEAIQGDASSRRYRRLHLPGGTTAVEVQYPPGEHTILERDLEVRAWLERRGLRVPRLLEADPAHGRAVLEDFGRQGAAEALAAAPPERRPTLVRRLLGPLERLASLDPGELPPWNAPLDASRMRWELAGFELWYLSDRRGTAPSPAAGRWLDGLAERVAAHPRRVCHRDYHLDNLFFLPGGEVGVIDFQDILIGPEGYDLVSLLEERDFPHLLGEQARRETAREWARRTGALPGWERRLAEVTAQRGLKVLGTFARLVASGREGYRAWLEELVPRQRIFLQELDAPLELIEALG